CSLLFLFSFLHYTSFTPLHSLITSAHSHLHNNTKSSRQMLPHLNQSRPGAHSRSYHEHYTGSCPLSCPARKGSPSQHYLSGGQSFQPHHPHLDASKLHPAFSGLFFQQRRTYTTNSQHPQAPHQPPPQMAFNHLGAGVGGVTTVPPPPGVITGPGDPRMQGGGPMLDHFAIATSGAPGGGGGGCGGGPAMMDPARTSPIFYGYSTKPDKPKM
ncbi:MAG: hypothetical protein J3R72DRAFT_173161, partial [Linnemannia gamsii]